MTENIPIMIVEDEPLLMDAISTKLKLSGYKPICCTTGKQAVDYAQNSLELPKLIWLDYYLKDMNGLEIMGALQKNALWASVPVIIVSNSASDIKRKSLLSLGAKRYFLKAENRLEDIISEIAKIITT